jgi:hypothetical protein
MNTNVAIGTVARVNFSKEVVEKGFVGMAVIKASPEMGFLVWLNGYGGSYSRHVTVSKNLGDEVTTSRTFLTVGHFYFLSAGNVANSELDQAEKGSSGWWDLYERMEDQFLAEPVRQACRRLGITKLWKHSGNDPFRPHPDLVVCDLTERGPISIEAQC